MSEKELSEEVKAALGPAELYERERVPKLFRPIALFFLKHVPLEKGEAVLDIACGTGIVARLASERVGPLGTVVGVDLDADMIRVAQEYTPPGASLSWHVGSVDAMPFFEDSSFDWVLCQQGFQFFNDKPGSLREVYRVLKPGGKLAMIMARALDKESYPLHWAEIEAITKYAGAKAAEKRKYPIWAFNGSEDELRSLIAGAGFKEINIQNGVSTRARGFPERIITEERYSDLDADTRAAVVAYVRKAIQPLRTKEGTEVPYVFHIAFGLKQDDFAPAQFPP